MAQAAASSAMEARDGLEEELSQARQALEAVQQQHDQLATTAQPIGRPEDAARIAQLADQVSPLLSHSIPLGGQRSVGGLVLGLKFDAITDCRVKELLVFAL